MAKHSDQLAGAPKTRKDGSPTSGLFAEENEFDRRALWRIGSWGAAAVGAVTLAVMSNQWSIGLRRDQLAAADVARQAQQIQLLAKESQNETRRLASAIETLNSDRDRLFSRVTVIEQGLDSVTGALSRQAAAPTSPAGPQASATQAAPTPPGAPQTPQQNAAVQPAAPAPVLAPVTTTAAAAADKPRAETVKPDAARAEVAKSEPAKSDAAKTDGSGAAMTTNAAASTASPATTATTSPAAAASLMTKSIMGPPDPAAPRLIEAAKPADAKLSDAKPAEAKAPDVKVAEAAVDARTDSKAAGKGPDALPSASSEVIASAKAMDDQETEVPNIAVKRTDFAVELGGANSVAGLRAIWRSVRHLNAELGVLNPIVVVREGHTGLGMQLHLAAGPLKDAAAAAKICAALEKTRRACETTVYDGQRLSMKTDEPQSPPTVRAATDSKSDAKAEARPDAKPEPKGEAKADAAATTDGKADAKTDPKAEGKSKRTWYRHSKKEEPAPPPPPPPAQPTSTFSSLFGRK